jgi:NAD(P)H dehydrogenase (quinone)
VIAVTGATGQLGGKAIAHLQDRGTPAEGIVAIARNADKASALAGKGVQVRVADYSRPETLVSAFRGVDRLLLVSGNEVGQRVAQHQNVASAARDAGVRLLIYTSIIRASSSPMQIAVEHRGSEDVIRASGVPFVFLRNSWYLENYTRNLQATLDRGFVAGSAGGGRVSAAARSDYAEAAASVLTGSGHENKAYELGGDEAFSLGDLVAELSRQSGRRIEYRDLPESGYVDALIAAGVPEPYARLMANSDQGIARGDLFTDSGDLRRLIGHPTIPLRDVVAAALRS